MPDELQPDELQPDTQPEDAQPEAAASAATKNTATATTEHMIPKSRFDAINDELKQLRAEQTKAGKAQADAERKAAEEQGKFKELYEKALTEAETERNARQTSELATLKNSVARAVGLPEKLALRLQGATAEEITADAKSILAELPKPAAPNINSGAGVGSAPVAGQMSTEQRIEMAAIYGVNPNYLS